MGISGKKLLPLKRLGMFVGRSRVHGGKRLPQLLKKSDTNIGWCVRIINADQVYVFSYFLIGSSHAASPSD
jgi:hypothetical protein